MTKIIRDNEPEIIAEDNARGARSAEKTSAGDTLVPMLVGGLVLVVLGLIVLMMIS